MQPQVFTVDDFSGGITDNYIAGNPNKYQKADNLLIEKHGAKGKLILRPGSELYNETYPQLPSLTVRTSSIYYFKALAGSLFFSDRDVHYLSAGWHTLTGPTSNKIFPSPHDHDSIITMDEWNNHVFVTSDAYMNPAKLYVDSVGALTLRSAGLPNLATSPTITPGANTSKSFTYGFAYYYTYMVGTVTFEDYGGMTEVQVNSADAPNTNANAISVIPAIANGANTNWDTANIKVKIYRTTNGGSTKYYVGQVSNGTTTFTDNVSDASLVLNVEAYTNGGVVSNDAPPVCKYLHITENNVGVYANIKDGTEILSNQINYSIPNDPDSCPADFFEQVDEEITGVSSLRSRVIVFCVSSVYRLEGFFDLQGRGSIQKTKISDVTGCVSAQSIVQTIDGIYWAGADGFYFTDGFKVLKISGDLDTTTYRALVDTTAMQKQIQGKYDRFNTRIWWAAQYSAGASDNDTCFVLDLRWGVSAEMPFTTVSGGSDFKPSAIEFEGKNLIRGNSNGYIFRHDEDLKVDPKISVGVAGSIWPTSAIIYEHKSCAFNYGTEYLRKFVPRITITLRNLSNLSVQIRSINDDGRQTADLVPIRFRGNLIWGDETLIWGDADLVWGFTGLIVEERHFPSRSLRFSYKQIQITNAFVNIANSDTYGNVIVDSGAKTATLIDSVTYNFPSNAVDYYISFSNDGYVRRFLVTAQSSDVLTFSDALNFAPSSSSIQWLLRGYPKGESINIISYTMGYNVFGQTQDKFNTGEAGNVGDT